MTAHKNLIDRNGWLADKIPAFGDFGKDVARQLKKNSDAIEALVQERDELVAALEMIKTHRWNDDQCDNGYSARYVAETALAKVGKGEKA